MRNRLNDFIEGPQYYLDQFKQVLNEKPKKNPVIDQAEQRGYEKGFAAGIEAREAQTINFMQDWFNGLENIPGIGHKTAERIRNEFLKKYGKR